MPTTIGYTYEPILGQLDEQLSVLLAHQAQAAAAVQNSSGSDQVHNQRVLDELTGKLDRVQAVRTLLETDCCNANCSSQLLP
jgi:hypothetical protein